VCICVYVCICVHVCMCVYVCEFLHVSCAAELACSHTQACRNNTSQKAVCVRVRMAMLEGMPSEATELCNSPQRQ